MADLSCQGRKAIITKQRVISDGLCEERPKEASFKRREETEKDDACDGLELTTGNHCCGAQKAGHSRRWMSVFLSLLGSNNATATQCCLTVCHIMAAPATQAKAASRSSQAWSQTPEEKIPREVAWWSSGC